MGELPSGTVTFLFTDLEDSTRLWDEHPEAMRGALARHDAILRDAIERNRGTLVKSTGDGAYAVFPSAPDAVSAAVGTIRELIREPWEATGPLRARIGIHTGTAEPREGDYFGPTLNRTSRLMAVAHGGQVVMSQACASSVGEELPSGVALRDLGEHRLRGLQGAERVFQVAIADAPAEFPPLRSLDAFPGALALPLPSTRHFPAEMAGRAVELELLIDTWGKAKAGARQVALVSGEPGIGKTRLLEKLARRVHARGGLVLHGRCDEELLIPHQPFIEALRPCVSVYPASALRQRLRGLEPDLARAFPELLGQLPEVAIPVASDPEAGRYRFFEAIATLVTGITAAQPTLLVLDDLHWADKSTLLLLRHLVRATASADLMIAAGYRNLELPPGGALADLLAGLRREVDLVQVLLAGIAEHESEALIADLAGHAVAAALASALHRESGGNPLFLEELVRHLVETGRLAELEKHAARTGGVGALDLPDGVREVVTRRLRRLPDPVCEILTVAAVVGHEFDAELLAHASDQSAATVLDLLGHATDAGLITPDPRLGRFAFEHALIRQTLNTALGPARAVSIHAAVGTALEATDDARPGNAAAIARHFVQSVPLTGAHKAVHYLSRAGREALADFAFEDASTCFADALRVYEEYALPDAAVHVELLTELAGALIQVDERAGVEVAGRAVEAARNDGSPEQFGRAVAAFVEPMYGVHTFPTVVTSVLDEARTVLGDDHAALRARLLAFEAFKYAAFQLHGRDGRVLAADAVATARIADDPITLSDALFAFAVSLEGADDVQQRLTIGEELLAIGEVTGARASAFGLRVLAGVQLELGDPDALASTIDQLERCGTQQRWLPASVYAMQWATTQALLEGRFDDVRVRGAQLGQYVRAYRGAASMYSMQAFYLGRELGTLAPIGPSIGDEDQSLLTWAMLSLARLESGDEAQAFANLDQLADAGLDRGPESRSGAALGMLAEVAAHRGTPRHAAELYTLLEPFGGRLLAFILGLACVGAADRYLGMLCTMLGRWDDASSHFDRAVELETGMRGHALVPRTRYWKAWSLRSRGLPEDEVEARALLDEVVDTTARLGMTHLREQAASLRDR